MGLAISSMSFVTFTCWISPNFPSDRKARRVTEQRPDQSLVPRSSALTCSRLVNATRRLPIFSNSRMVFADSGCRRDLRNAVDH